VSERTEDDDGALAALRRAVARLPDDPALRLHLAELLLTAGEAEEALAHALVVAGQGHEPARAAALADRARRAAARRADPPPAATDSPVAPVHAAEPAAVEDTGLDDIELDAFLRRAVAAEAAEAAEVERARTRFDDVAGLDEVVAEIRGTFLVPLRDPGLRRTYGLTPAGGLLLYGPPGCGKTLIARALAGEADARFIALSLADLVTEGPQSAPAMVQAIFAEARRVAPTVLFLDEVDAVGPRRTQVTGIARAVVTQLLQEMDGIEVRTESVLLLGATNQPWSVDPALRRPGRFDRTLLVLPPDRTGREAILAQHLRDRPVERVDVGDLARRTEGYSGADLRLLCDTAARRVAVGARHGGARPPITGRDLKAALKEVPPSIGPWLEVARNFATFANGSGEYDDLLAYLDRRGRRR
jgi:SpoVK/Ycf46/Vps4 family AAA+-type ATPase